MLKAGALAEIIGIFRFEFGKFAVLNPIQVGLKPSEIPRLPVKIKETI